MHSTPVNSTIVFITRPSRELRNIYHTRSSSAHWFACHTLRSARHHESFIMLAAEPTTTKAGSCARSLLCNSWRSRSSASPALQQSHNTGNSQPQIAEES
jgi:hypothetical protein